nr:copia protein [Tanacetum cinerariifolium]
MRGHFARKCRSPKDTRNKDIQRRSVLVNTYTSNVLVSQCDGVGSYDWSFQADEELTNYPLMAFASSSSTSSLGFDSECDAVGGYDWSFQAEEEPTNYALMAYALSGSSSSLGSDNEVAPCFKACLESVEARLVVYQQNEIVFEEDIKLLKLDIMLRDNALAKNKKKFEKAEQERNDLKLTLDKFQTSSKNLSKLLKSQVYDKTGLGFDSQMFNSQVFDCEELRDHESDNTVPKNPENDRSRLVSLNAARPVLTVVTQSSVKSPWPIKHVVNKAHLPVRRPINQRPATKNSNFNKKVTIVKVNKVNVVYCTKGNAKKASIQVSNGLGPQKTLSFLFDVHGNPQQALKDKGIIDSGCSRHMIGNISFLSDFEEIDGGYVAFGGNPKDTECVVLSSDYKLPNENHVLLRVSRENNMYNVDLKNVVPSGDLTCLFTKATLDEVLVTKPHNKTPYELLLCKPPSIGFMRPFGCHVTILNTLYPLRKFGGKDDEGFLGGYSLNSKAFRVFNSRTRIVQETLHINFLENKPNIAWIRPKWLFDIDTLTMFMNYQPVVTVNQPNYNAGIKENFNAGKVRKETISAQEYCYHYGLLVHKIHRTQMVLLLMLPLLLKRMRMMFMFLSMEVTSLLIRNMMKRLKDMIKERVIAPVNAAGPNPTNSCNSFNSASPSINVVSPNIGIARKSSFMDPSKYPDDPDMPETEDIVYSDDEKDVGAEADLSNLESNIFVSPIQLLDSINIIMNKKDERGIVIRSKARLVAQGHTQEEGIDYDEIFALVARIEAIRLFLASTSFMGFMVYHMDVKSAFLYETIEEEVYVYQPPGFEDLNYCDKFVDQHNMVAYLEKSDDDRDFHQIVDFFSSCAITYAITAKATVKKVNDVVKLRTLIDGKKVVVSEAIIRRDIHLDDADGVECFLNKEIFKELVRMGRRFNFSKHIFDNMVRNVDSPSKFLMYPRFLQVIMDNQVDDMTSHNTRYTSPTLTQKVFANMQRIGKDQPSIPHASPPQEQPTTTSESFMSLLTTLMETCATLSQKVAELEQEKHSQDLEILQLKKRVKKLEKKKRSKSLGFKRLRRVAIDDDEDITLVDVEKDKEVVSMDVKPQERINQKGDNAATKGVSAAEPIVFDDEELHDEEVEKAAARDKQEKDDMERAQVFQKQYDDKEENID